MCTDAGKDATGQNVDHQSRHLAVAATGPSDQDQGEFQTAWIAGLCLVKQNTAPSPSVNLAKDD
jgi:hypothetical protein